MTRASGASKLRFACQGSSGAGPTARWDTTALLIRAGQALCLVDVGGSPIQECLAHVGYQEHARPVARVREARAFGGPVTMAKELCWYRV